MTILNVGSGEVHDADAINVDIRPVADVQADVRDLPYLSNTVDEVRAYDVLEHLTEGEYSDALVEWHRVLKPEGLLRLRVPNLYSLAMMVCRHADETDGILLDVIRNLVGGHKFGERGEWDTHHWLMTPAILAFELNRHGFDLLSNDMAPNMTVTARKRGSR